MGEADVSFARLERDGAERFQRLRAQLGVSAFGMNLIVLQPGQRSRIHAHTQQEEVYLVLEGELTLLVAGEEHLLGSDQLARVGHEVRRQLLNAGPDRLVLLALGGYGDHEGRDGLAWTSWEDSGPGMPPADVPLPDDLGAGSAH
jgi:uncharacterized cupin superfamily protein